MRPDPKWHSDSTFTLFATEVTTEVTTEVARTEPKHPIKHQYNKPSQKHKGKLNKKEHTPFVFIGTVILAGMYIATNQTSQPQNIPENNNK